MHLIWHTSTPFHFLTMSGTAQSPIRTAAGRSGSFMVSLSRSESYAVHVPSITICSRRPRYRLLS